MKKNNLLEKISLSFFLPPILLTIFPILSFYSNNVSELSLKFLGKPMFYSITVVLIAVLSCFFLTKNKNKTSLIVSLFVFIFFSYGHLSNALNSKLFIQLPNNIILGPDKILLPIIFGLFGLFAFKVIKSPSAFSKTISFLNIILLILVGYLAITIVKKEQEKKKNDQTELAQFQENNLTALENTPDIYYIILDGYAREDILERIYDFDNSKFTNNLEKMGFYVADSARSNYIHTYLSLPSTLNMRYLDELPKKYGVNPVDGSASRELTANNEVNRKLKSHGYKIINFASIWEGTNENYKADITYSENEYFKILGKNIAIDETSIAFLQNTLLSPLIKEVWRDALRSRTLATLQKLPTIAYQQEKKFTIAHILAPHPPYVFTAKGDPVPNAEFEMADEGIDKRPKYLDQLIFISNQIIPILQKIIKNSQNPPVIILQADHGPASIFGKRDDWLKNYSQEGVIERSSILYAVYFPDQNYEDFYNTITPVNTFRILFNKYFKEDFKLLEDKSFYTSYEAIYGFKDITDIK